MKVIVDGAGHKNSDIRALSCEILGEIGNKSAAKLLKKKLRDASAHARIAAAGALYKLGDKSGLKVLYSIINDVPGKKPILNNPLLEMKIISKNKIREKAIETLAEILGGDSKEVLFALKRDSYGIVRDAAARELARLGENSETARFVYALEDEDDGIRYEAAKSVARICSGKTLEAMRNLMKIETSMDVKMAVFDYFLCLGDKDKLFMDMLKISLSKNPTIKFKAVLVLAGMDDGKAGEKLAEIFRESNDLGVKVAALGGMPEKEKNARAGVLVTALRSGEEDIKEAALRVLEKMDMSKIKKTLAGVLEDEDYRIRLLAARQLVQRLARK